MALPSIAAVDAWSPVTWVLHDGKAGMASQALGLAEATGPKPRTSATARPPGGTTRGETSGSQRNSSRLVTGVATLVQSLSFGGSKGYATTSSSAKPTGKDQRK